MKTVDKMEVLHSQSAEYIQQGETGKFLKLIPDTFLIKGKEKDGVFNQGYAIRHINRRDILLIDVVEEENIVGQIKPFHAGEILQWQVEGIVN